MEDKRITKTKKNLKYTLVDMLAEQPFEKITITELCSRTEISRITFYSHYSDKYALVDEMFQDMIVLGTKEYEKKQNETNPDRNEIKSYWIVSWIYIMEILTFSVTQLRIKTLNWLSRFIVLFWKQWKDIQGGWNRVRP